MEKHYSLDEFEHGRLYRERFAQPIAMGRNKRLMNPRIFLELVCFVFPLLLAPSIFGFLANFCFM